MAATITDKDRLDFIEERARLSRSCILFDWDGHGVYRYVEPSQKTKGNSVREAIDIAITTERKLK